MDKKTCPICEKAYPATPEYFYRDKQTLRKHCKKCENKRLHEYKRKKKRIIPDKCKTCQKLDKGKNKCMVLIEFLEDCWSWTDDMDWLKKARKAAEDYKRERELRE